MMELEEIKKAILILMTEHEDDEEAPEAGYDRGYDDGYHDALVDVLNAFKIPHDFQWRN